VKDCRMQLTDEPDKRCYPLHGALLCQHCHLRRLNDNYQATMSSDDAGSCRSQLSSSSGHVSQWSQCPSSRMDQVHQSIRWQILDTEGVFITQTYFTVILQLNWWFKEAFRNLLSCIFYRLEARPVNGSELFGLVRPTHCLVSHPSLVKQLDF